MTVPAALVEPAEPGAGLVQEVVPGVWRLRTPMPGHSFGSLNSYLLTSGDDAVLVDTPWGTPEVTTRFRELVEATGTALESIRMVLVTHFHEDHSGAAGWLQTEVGAEVVMHEADARVRAARFATEEYAAELDRWLHQVGVDDEGVRYAREQYRRSAALFSRLEPDWLVEHGETIAVGDLTIEALHTPGHTPGHLCFLDRERGLLFAGDHVFARRRANATARPPAVDRPIRTYWESTAKLLDLAGKAGAPLVLPGHEEPFTDLAGRVRHLADVRRAKSAEVVELAGRHSTAWQVAQAMKRRSPWSDLDGNARLAAAGEALAYLLEAQDEGHVHAEGRSPRRWRAVRHEHAARDSRSTMPATGPAQGLTTGGTVSSLFYEDLVEGQTFTSNARTVTETDVVGFAGLSGDFNPIHLDRESTKQGMFGQRVAHGVLGIAMATGFLDSLGLFKQSMGAMLGIDDWQFISPIFIGDTIHLEVVIESKRLTSKGTSGVVRRRLRLVNQHGEVVQEGAITVLILCRETPVSDKPVPDGPPETAPVAGAPAAEAVQP